MLDANVFNGFNNSANYSLYLNEAFSSELTNGNEFMGQTWKEIVFESPQ